MKVIGIVEIVIGVICMALANFANRSGNSGLAIGLYIFAITCLAIGWLNIYLSGRTTSLPPNTSLRHSKAAKRRRSAGAGNSGNVTSEGDVTEKATLDPSSPSPVITWWNDYTVNKSGAVEKLVRCEKCSAEYLYTLSVSVTGEAESLFSLANAATAEMAESRAEKELLEQLKRGIEPRPCPACGHFQPEMVSKARTYICSWMSSGWLILFLFLASLAASPWIAIGVAAVLAYVHREVRELPQAIYALIFYGVPGGIALTILLLPVFRWLMARFHDPNRLSVEARERRGYFPGILRSDYEREKQEELGNLANLTERAEALLKRPHPLHDVREKQAFNDVIRRYLAYEAFIEPELRELLQNLGNTARAKVWQYDEYEIKDYYRQYGAVLDGIFLEVFGYSPRSY